MSKDPAFLFYSKDFYEGTRLMLPEERACYIDLMIYQHQHGYIPKNLKRVLMYCSGVDEETLKATLEAKFKLCDEGWYNEKLQKISEERKEFSSKQSDNGKVGQFFKTAKSELSAKKFKELKDFVYQDFGKEELLKIIKNKNTLKASLKAMLKHLENGDVNEIEDVNENKEKEGVGEKTKPQKKTEEEISEINYPWPTETFKAQWKLWKLFKKKKFKFSYLNAESENRVLTELKNLSGNDEKKAVKIIQQSIDNGWKGFFELKNKLVKPKEKQTASKAWRGAIGL